VKLIAPIMWSEAKADVVLNLRAVAHWLETNAPTEQERYAAASDIRAFAEQVGRIAR
jgi:hypothetical protein